jgi:uncharacterized protein YbjT (DUF2867 family)
MSVLVVGGSGHVGGAITLGLAKQQRPVAAMLRGGSSHPSAAQLADIGVRVVEGDLWRHDALRSVVRGAETVVSTATAMPMAANDGIRKTDHEGTLALIEAAEAEGVRRFVYVSYSGNIQDESPLQTAKRACEQRLNASGMETVILRPSYFLEVWLSPMLGFDPANGSIRIYGSGEKAVTYIAASNVAEFALAAVSAKVDAKHSVIELGGPDNFSQIDVVRLFEQKLGRPMKLDFVPVEALQAQHQSADPLQKTFAALMLAYTKGDVIKDALQNAQRFNIRLRSVAEYVSQSAAPVPVS